MLLDFVLFISIFAAGILTGSRMGVRPNTGYIMRLQPSELLGFIVPDANSTALRICIAQAELTRHGIDCTIDEEWGKQTAMGICELLVKIEEGYDVYGKN